MALLRYSAAMVHEQPRPADAPEQPMQAAVSGVAPPLDVDVWRVAIGPGADRYLPIFRKIEARGGGWVAGWNWAAFAASMIWLFYRRMPRLAFANILFLPLVMFLMPMLVLAILPGFVAQFIQSITLLFYVFIAFVAMPAYADALYYRELKRKLAERSEAPARIAALAPSWRSAVGGVLLGMCLPVGAIAIAMIARSDLDARLQVSEAILAASSTRNAVEGFHALHKRLPTQGEAAGLSVPPALPRVQSVNWDAARQRIVVTLPGAMAGKQLALHAEMRDDAITWTCRNIDAPPKYVPVTCRN